MSNTLARPRSCTDLFVSFMWMALQGFGGVLAVVQRDNRALHDLLARTSVVYDWGERSVQLPGPLSDFIARSEARLDGAGRAEPRA